MPYISVSRRVGHSPVGINKAGQSGHLLEGAGGQKQRKDGHTRVENLLWWGKNPPALENTALIDIPKLLPGSLEEGEWNSFPKAQANLLTEQSSFPPLLLKDWAHAAAILNVLGTRVDSLGWEVVGKNQSKLPQALQIASVAHLIKVEFPAAAS